MIVDKATKSGKGSHAKAIANNKVSITKTVAPNWDHTRSEPGIKRSPKPR